MTLIHRGMGLLAAMIAITGCGSQAVSPVPNPIADSLRAQARQLTQSSVSCREDAAAYRESHPQALRCDTGVITIGLTNGRPIDQCAANIIASVPSCRQWDDDYRAMAGIDDAGGMPTPRAVILMESKELDPPSGLAADENDANASRVGD